MHEAPPGPLGIAVAFDGATVVASLGSRGVLLETDDGTRLAYDQLAAWDAAGRALPATMRARGDVVDVVVDLTDAALPVVVDPVLSTATSTLSATLQERFGYRIAGDLDYNLDGYADVVVSSPDGSSREGIVRLYQGNATGCVSTSVVQAVGDNAGQYLGLGLANVGDVDGNGVDDFAAGAPVSLVQKVALYRLDAGGISGSKRLNGGGGSNPYGRYGSALAGGDINGDGYADVVSADPNWVSSKGHVDVHHGASAFAGGWNASTVLYGNSAGDLFGYALGVGDIDADGYADVVVGAPGVGLSTGQVYVYHGSASGLSTTATTTLSGSTAGLEYGAAVAVLGDVNGDGYDDVAIAAPQHSSATGRVWVFHGRGAGMASTATTTLSGGAAGDEFGTALAAAGDVNGDGYDDLLVGAPAAGGGAGAAYVFHGSATGVGASPVNTFTGSGTDALGTGLAGAGDVNNDGYDDIVLGLPGASSSFGSIELHFGCADADGDGYCVAGIGYSEDCDDTDASVHPGATEVVGDGIDQDCDGQEECYVDADGDGYTDGSTVTSLDEDCDDAGEGDDTTAAGDCDDSDGDVHPGATEVVGDEVDQDCDGVEECWDDADADGYHAGTSSVSADMDCQDAGEADATTPGGDCDDGDAAINPAATEITGDGVDQDCDGEEACYVDADSDGYRTGDTVTSTDDTDCSDAGEALSTATSGDCDDSDASVHPGAAEVTADGVDQDCDGQEACYVDADDDGYRLTTSTVTSSDADCSDSGEALASEPDGDCDDTDASINPGVAEVVADEIDQDCDGGEICYADADADTYRTSSTVRSSDSDCTDSGEAAAVLPAGDCDDSDATLHPGATEGIGDEVDQDCDGEELCYVDADRDGYRTGATVTSGDTDCSDTGEATSSTATGDCDDTSAAVNPGATERCNGVDDDCDGTVDGASAVDAATWFDDDDADGFGDAGSPSTECTQPSGTVSDATDCDDSEPLVYPGGFEYCDGLDNDCDGVVDDGAPPDFSWYADVDGDGFGDPTTLEEACIGPADAVQDGTDCDDTVASIHPGAEELCDGIDQDCDGLITGETDDDGDGYAPCDGDCWEGDATVNPDGVETPDGVDDDCDGIVDDGTAAADDDGDGLSEREGDCDDTDATVYPGAPELPDGLDQDCDEEADEGTEAADDDGDGTSELDGDCDDTTRAVGPHVTERCTEVGQLAIDDDCDGEIDEGCEDTLKPGTSDCEGCASSGRGSSGALLVGLGLFGALLRRRRGRGGLAVAGAALLGGCQDAALYKLEADEDPIPDPPWLEFGVVTVGESATLPLSLRNPGRVDITLTRATVNGVDDLALDPPMARTVLTSEGSSDGQDYIDLLVDFTPDGAGQWDGLLVFDLAGAVSERLAVPVYAAAAPPSLAFSPAVLDVGETGESPDYLVQLLNTGENPVTVTGVGLPGAAWTVEGVEEGAVVEPGSSLPLTIAAATSDRSVDVLEVAAIDGTTWSLELRANACDLEPVTVQDLDEDGLSPCGGDCDDQDPSRRPGLPEVAGDGVDSDCDGVD